MSNNINSSEDRQGTLDDESRVRVLSPGMLVAKRFFRNRLAMIGLFIIIAMFIFSFAGGFISPYGEAQVFRTVKETMTDYAGASYNEDYKFTMADGQKLPSMAQSKFILATHDGDTTFEAKDQTYTLEKAGNDGDNRYECITECMMIDYAALGKSLRTCGSDVIRIENFKHVGSGITHHGSHADNRQCQNRQNHMLADIKELHHGTIALVISAYNTIQVKPSEFYGKNVFQNRRKEKARKRNTDQRNDCNCIICVAVLLSGRNNAQRNGNDIFQEGCTKCQCKGIPDDLSELGQYRNIPIPGITEITSYCLSQPVNIAGDNANIQTICFIQLIQPLLIAFGSGLL